MVTRAVAMAWLMEHGICISNPKTLKHYPKTFQSLGPVFYRKRDTYVEENDGIEFICIGGGWIDGLRQ